MSVTIIITVSLIFLSSVAGFCQDSRNDIESLKNPPKQNSIPKCPENPDSLYDRQKILEQLADILNASIPEYRAAKEVEFKAKDGRGNLFFVYDLTDPTNKSSLTTVCIDFRDKHIYHFAPLNYDYSYSHVVILENGKLKIFKSINCPLSKDKVEDVIKYLEQMLKNDKYKDEILERVRNYRKYGKYYSSDLPRLKCGANEEEISF